MSIIGDGIMLGSGGESASIFVTGLSETDNVSATHKIPGKVPNPEWKVPDGYTQLEYIESMGTQYIDTGYKPKTTTTVKTRFYSEPYTSFDCPFGCRTTSTSNAFLLFTRYNGTAKSTFNHGNSENFIATDNMYNKWLDVSTDDSHLYMVENNNLLYTLTFNGTAQDTEYNLFLFNLNEKGSIYSGNVCATKCKMSYFQTYENGTLVRNFIPCKRNSDSAVGMYDLVTNAFFENAGTGTFVAGPEIPQYIDGYVDGKTIAGKWTQKPNSAYRNLPDGYTQLEYIQSSGTQYIDTGIIGKSGIEVETKLMWLSAIDDQSAIGARNGSTRIYPVDLDSGKWSLGYSGNNVSSVAPVQNQVYDVYSKLYAGSQILKVDGTTILNLSISSSYNTNLNLWMPSTNYDGGYAQNSSVRIYFMRIKMDGVLVRNFIPCKRNSDGSNGVYDLVSGTFYTNAGTGTFTAGAEIPQTIDGFLIDKIKDYGTWTVTATNGTKTVTQDVLVDAAEIFTVKFLSPVHTELEISSTGTLTVYNGRTVTKKNSGDAIRFVCIVYFPSVNSSSPYYITQVLLSKTLGVESLYNSYKTSDIWSSQNRPNTWWVSSIEYYGETWYAGVDGYGWLNDTYDKVASLYQNGYLLNSLANNNSAFSDSETAFKTALDYYYGLI